MGDSNFGNSEWDGVKPLLGKVGEPSVCAVAPWDLALTFKPVILVELADKALGRQEGVHHPPSSRRSQEFVTS